MTSDSSPPNRLATETSPYLRQHARNPVDWRPWGAPALQAARAQHKPILLSIGYAACHWCHVMAHESFEDPATAALMNELFINIKVDREERPDLDRIYQLSHQMLTGRGGGWPLTMFLMHDDQRPFFGGTYFPKDARYGLPGFADLLRQVSDYYRLHEAELRSPAAQIVAALADLNAPPTDQSLSDEPLKQARARFEHSFDADNGGFGGAPKFPQPGGLRWLLRAWYDSARDAVPDLQALYMSTLTLTRMADGGLFDQLGGGFFRYSVDERWEIPHFEKMLYDNAQLLQAYAEASHATGESLFRDAAVRTADWMLRELADRSGGFYSSLDADSEGHEGRFYVWQRDEVRSLLSEHEFASFSLRFGLDQSPNFERDWHLTVRVDLDTLAAQRGVTEAEAAHELAAATAQLLAVRSKRVRPALDDKLLTSWNALSIGALAVAARHLQRPDYTRAALGALDFLHSHHWRDGRLFATSAGGPATLPAYLDDYAFVCAAILEVVSVQLRAADLQWAVELAELMLRHFEDAEQGGFFFTADDHEQLINRPKSFSDEAIPAGNAVAAAALMRLGYLLGNTRYLDSAQRTLRAAWPALLKYPQAHASLLAALQEYLSPTKIVILRGPADAVQAWQQQLHAAFAPDRWIIAAPNELRDLPSAIADKPGGERVCAYVCSGLHCSAAITDLEQLSQALDSTAA